MTHDNLSDSNSCALFAAFEHSQCGGDGDDGHAAFDEEGIRGKKFVVLQNGQSYESECLGSSSSSSSTITIVCNTHLFSNNAGDSVRLIQVFHFWYNLVSTEWRLRLNNCTQSSTHIIDLTNDSLCFRRGCFSKHCMHLCKGRQRAMSIKN